YQWPSPGKTLSTNAVNGCQVTSCLNHWVPASGAPHSLQKTASPSITGWPHCEQKRARSFPVSAMEGKDGISQFQRVAILERLFVDFFAGDKGAVLAAQIAHGEGPVIRLNSRVMTRHGRIVYHDIIVERAADLGRDARSHPESLARAVDQPCRGISR